MSTIDSSNKKTQIGDDKMKTLPKFRRLTSIESTVSSIRLSVFELNTTQNAKQKYSLCSVEFMIKLVQLLISIACIGLYSCSIQFMKDSELSLIFPDVVYGAFVIITTVTVLSYILGHLMPPIILRIFLVIAIVLYLVAGCVTFHNWYKFAKDTVDKDRFNARLLLTDSLLNLLNCALYGCDLYSNIKKSLTV